MAVLEHGDSSGSLRLFGWGVFRVSGLSDSRIVQLVIVGSSCDC